MKVKVISRRILQDGRLLFNCQAGEGKEAKQGNLMITKAMIETLKEVGDDVPKIGAVIDAEWSVDAMGTQSQEWLSI